MIFNSNRIIYYDFTYCLYISITHLIVETLLNPYARCVPQLPYPLFAAQLNTVEGASPRHALLLFFF